MKTSIGLLSVAFATLAFADTISDNVRNICETSDSSPYLHNVNEMIDNLKDAEIGESTCNPTTNGCGETITDYSGEGGAAFMLCGSGMRCSGDPGGMPCAGGGCGGMAYRGMPDYLEPLRDECQSPDSNGDIRVGGIVKMMAYNHDGTPDEDTYDELKLFSKPG